MNIELTGTEVLAGISLLAMAISVGIVLFKKYLQLKDRSTSHSISTDPTRLTGRTKNPDKNFMSNRSTCLGIGLTSSILFAIIAMSWTTYERKFENRSYVETIIEEDLKIVSLILQLPPPAPPLPPAPKIEIIDKEIIDDSSDILETEPLLENDFIDEFIPPTSVSPPSILTPPPLPKPVDDEPEELFFIIENMPLFGNCDDKKCSDERLMKYIYKQIKYPRLAAQNGIQGRITAEFVVEKTGEVSNIKILRGIGAGCDEEVLKVLGSMNNEGVTWKPGSQRGKPVRVLYRLPVTFELKH